MKIQQSTFSVSAQKSHTRYLFYRSFCFMRCNKISLASLLSCCLLFFSALLAAEDIEIYIGDKSYRQGQKPQVLIIFDNSGSMRTTLYVKPPYDPTYDYLNRRYFSSIPSASNLYLSVGVTVNSQLPNPNTGDTSKRFSASINACHSALTKIADIGYFTGHVRNYTFVGNSGSWKTISGATQGSELSLLDCWEDVIATEQGNNSATLPNGDTATSGYPVDGLGTSQNPVYFSTDINLTSSTFGAGEVTTLYSENYLRWYHATDLGTVPRTRLDIAKQTMVELLGSAPALDFGLMVFNLNAFSEYQRDGGRIVAAVGSNNTDIINTISNIDAETNTPLCESLYEAYRYFSGQNVVFGKADSNASWRSGGRRVYYSANQPPRDTNAETGNRYLSPFADKVDENGVTFKQCANDVNVILITDGRPTVDGAANASVRGLNPSGDVVSNSYLASLAHWMHNNDIYGDDSDGEQNANIYTIGFGQDAINSAGTLLARTAELGGGQYFPAEDAVALQRSLQVALSDILKVSSSFTSPTVASNNFDRTRSLDSVYYSMFLPAQGPRWAGNIKKLRMLNNVLVDARSAPAVSDSGVIKDGALTIWSAAADGDDGNDVEKGGVAAMLRDKQNRKLYTDIGSGSPLPTLNRNTLQNALGGASSLASTMQVEESVIDEYLDWARGIDVDDANGNGSRVDNRDDIFGDPLHSRPAVINYGPASNPDIRLVVGTNAGFLHMFDDNGNSVDESWAFMPSALLQNIKPLKDNFPGTAKQYGLDGSPVVYLIDKDNDGLIEASDGDKVWVFIGMRRGGSAYYAFDLTMPDVPRLMWIVSAADAGFNELGQTWSTPRVAFLKGHISQDGAPKPVLVFGAGYSPSKDSLTKTADVQGRGLFIIDAETKALLWSLTPGNNSSLNTSLPDIVDSVPAPLTPLDSDFDGFIDRIYFSDTGGNVWRVDLPSEVKNDWKAFKLAALGGDNAADRRFFSEPIVARSFFEQVTVNVINGERSVIRRKRPFDAVLLGSGNRAHPAGVGVDDVLFMLQDWKIVPLKASDSRPSTLVLNDLFDSTDDPFFTVSDPKVWEDQEAILSGYSGWYYRMNAGSEKSLSAALVLGGVAYFTSFTPAAAVESNQCLLEAGSGQLYAFNLQYGSRVFRTQTLDVGDRIPDTLELFLGENAEGYGRLMLLGVGSGDNSSGAVKPPVACIGGAECIAVRQKCQANSECSAQTNELGLKTKRTYLYITEDDHGL